MAVANLEAAVCWYCIVAIHEECLDTQPLSDDDPDVLTCCCQGDEDVYAVVISEPRGVGRPVKEPGDVTDPTSTGRKRAALVAPIYDGMSCEWAWLAAAGGGVAPIVGCAGNTLKATKSGTDKGDRHHGPDKNVLNNSPKHNLHVICTWCHHAWHAANDRYYKTPRPTAGEQWTPEPEYGKNLEHDPRTRATEDQVKIVYTDRGWHWPSDRTYPLD